MSTVGDFLVEKMGNMHQWLKAECGTYDSQRYDNRFKCITPTVATVMAEVLLANKTVVYHKDWYNLCRIPDLPIELVDLAEVVRPQDQLHDKFWRYLELFVESVSSDK